MYSCRSTNCTMNVFPNQKNVFKKAKSFFDVPMGKVKSSFSCLCCSAHENGVITSETAQLFPGGRIFYYRQGML